MVSIKLLEKNPRKTDAPMNPLWDQPLLDPELRDPESLEADLTLDRVAPTDEEVLKRIRDLPPEIAVLLFSVGCLGFVLPGMVGTPAIVAGGLVLWPGRFGKIETWFETRFPKIHHKSMKQLGRFLDDLERRYPLRSGR